MKKTLCILLSLIILTLTLFGCTETDAETKAVTEKQMPSDFSFSITWGVCGISSYDSKSGTLIKSNAETDTDKYTATVKLTDEQLRTVYKLLYSDINIADYPDKYNPFDIESSPCQHIIISATADGVSKTVSCIGVALGSAEDASDAKARAFLTSKESIAELLTSLPEWKAFPDYTVFFD